MHSPISSFVERAGRRLHGAANRAFQTSLGLLIYAGIAEHKCSLLPTTKAACRSSHPLLVWHGTSKLLPFCRMSGSERFCTVCRKQMRDSKGGAREQRTWQPEGQSLASERTSSSWVIQFVEAITGSAEEVEDYEYYWKCRRALQASTGKADSGFPGVVGAVAHGLDSESRSLARRASPIAARTGAALHTADSRAVATIGSADCAVSGFAGGADIGGVDISRAGRRGRQMGASES